MSALTFLFPGNALINSILATSYISIIPNLFLYFIPPDIKPCTLNTLVNFAVGSLLGDVFLHLLPHAFSNQHDHDHHASTHNNELKNVWIGVGVFTGLFFFYAADKISRAFFEIKEHTHSEKDHTEHLVNQVTISESTSHQKSELRQRNINSNTSSIKNSKDTTIQHDKMIRASTYLNLIADFTHNLTDGIAMAASFYVSPTIGATTAIAVFFHEIPHEISDYAILLKSGFSKKKAMMVQFMTAIGAYIGTFIGICIEEMAIRLSSINTKHHHERGHFFGTPIAWGDFIIAMTAGGFLYIATVGVIPELLEQNKVKSKLHQTIKELLFMIFGLLLMGILALNETKGHHHHH
ncbi:Zinc/iron permease [Cokeromyces recurvatus]|uniref:Zinc/iron permease n=1 Tax=Cokeromyces recurvatus TaxID=90255 RepID=UPI00221E3866|nr:Zinc/iron permease [Cokeromyces recurvatus]KAI7901425.1 Zinc/iron permease [Cokeromyces recurvatus]